VVIGFTGMYEVRFRLGQCFLASMMILGRWWCGVSIRYLKSRACGEAEFGVLVHAGPHITPS
jgi:hypothetical protein